MNEINLTAPRVDDVYKQDVRQGAAAQEPPQGEAPKEQAAKAPPEAPMTADESLLDALKLLNFKPTPENLNLAKGLLNGGLPVTEDNVRLLNKAVRLTGDMDAAVFMLKNNLAVNEKAAALVKGLDGGEIKVSELLERIAEMVERLPEGEVKARIAGLLTGDGGGEIAGQARNDGHGARNDGLGVRGDGTPMARNDGDGILTARNDGLGAGGQMDAMADGKPRGQGIASQVVQEGRGEIAGQARNDGHGARNDGTLIVRNDGLGVRGDGGMDVLLKGEIAGQARNDGLAARNDGGGIITARNDGIGTPIARNDGTVTAPPQPASAQSADAGARIAGSTLEISTMEADLGAQVQTRAVSTAPQGSPDTGALLEQTMQILNKTQALQGGEIAAQGRNDGTQMGRNDGLVARNDGHGARNDGTLTARNDGIGTPIARDDGVPERGSFLRAVLDRFGFNPESEGKDGLNYRLNDLRETAARARAEVANLGDSDAARGLGEALERMERSLDLFSDLRRFMYMQVPLWNGEERRNMGLYVFENKGKKAAGAAGKQSALLSLDFAYLGHFEAFIQKHGNGVNISFKTEEGAREVVLSSIHELSLLLASRGYRLDGYNFMKAGESFGLVDAEGVLAGGKDVGFGRLDVRA